MHIIITLRISDNGVEKDFDIKVDRKQRIKNSLEIVFHSLQINIKITEIHFIKSTRNANWFSVNYTYEQADIYTGDILEIKGL
jgi:uncharacterized ubiquitin-like protein YukD